MKNFKTLFSLVIACALSISMAYGQEDVFTEGFAGTPSGWSIENTFFSNSSNGVYEGAKSVKLKNDAATTITTSVYNLAAQLSYYILPKKDDNTGATVLVQKSIDGGTTWIDVHTTTVTAEQVADPSVWFKDSCDIDEASVMIKITSTSTSPMYLDDMRLTKTAVGAANTDLDSIFINDGYMMATIGQMDYSVDLCYVPEVLVDASAVSSSATVSVVQAADIFSTIAADRTAVITVKSEDATASTDYNIVLNISTDTLVNENFGSNTLVSNYNSTAQYLFTTPSGGNDLPASTDGSNVFGFVKNSILTFNAVENAAKLSFKAALRKDLGDNYEIKIFKYTGADSTLLETLSITGSGLDTAQWKDFMLDINETEATSIKFINYQDSEDSRICIDDVVITRAETSASVASLNGTKVSIYPNPAQNQLSISGVEGQFAVNIYALNGVQVLNAVNTTSIDISAISAGCYLVKVQADNATMVQRLIVK